MGRGDLGRRPGLYTIEPTTLLGLYPKRQCRDSIVGVCRKSWDKCAIVRRDPHVPDKSRFRWRQETGRGWDQGSSSQLWQRCGAVRGPPGAPCRPRPSREIWRIGPLQNKVKPVDAAKSFPFSSRPDVEELPFCRWKSRRSMRACKSNLFDIQHAVDSTPRNRKEISLTSSDARSAQPQTTG